MPYSEEIKEAVRIQNEKYVSNMYKFKIISSSYPKLFLAITSKLCVIKRVKVTYNEAPRNKKIPKIQKTPQKLGLKISSIWPQIAKFPCQFFPTMQFRF